jgi:hypothetical protein
MSLITNLPRNKTKTQKMDIRYRLCVPFYPEQLTLISNLNTMVEHYF